MGSKVSEMYGSAQSTLTLTHLIGEGGFARFKTQAILLQNCFIPRGLVNQNILVFNLRIMTKNRSKKISWGGGAKGEKETECCQNLRGEGFFIYLHCPLWKKKVC